MEPKRKITTSIGWAAGVIGSLSVLAAQTSFQDATSNLSSWAKGFGVANLPPWLTDAGVDWYATVIGIVLLGVATVCFVAWLLRKFKAETSAVLLVEQDELIPLPDAARFLYEGAREKATMWARAAEKLSNSKTDGSPDEILNWIATYICGKVAMFGTRPPSAKREPIQDRKGYFESGALVYKTDGHVYTDLAIHRRDTQKLLAMLIEEDSALS